MISPLYVNVYVTIGELCYYFNVLEFSGCEMNLGPSTNVMNLGPSTNVME